MKKKVTDLEIEFTNESEKGDLNYFWFNAFLTKDKKPYFSIGINGRNTSVNGRYDQKFSLKNAKDIVKFLSEKIIEIENETNKK